MRCPGCHHTIPDTARFCAYCGTVVQTQAAPAAKGVARWIPRLVSIGMAILLLVSVMPILIGWGRATLQEVQDRMHALRSGIHKEPWLSLETGSPVYSVAFSPDGGFLASESENGVTFWGLSDRKRLGTQYGYDTVVDAALNPDWSIVAFSSLGDPFTIHLEKISDGELLGTLKGQHLPLSIAFSPGGSILASGARDSTVNLWAISDAVLEQFKEAWSARLEQFMEPRSAREDWREKVRKASDAALLRTLRGHREAVLSVAFSPDGSILASGSRDGTAKLWRVSNGALLRTLDGHESPVGSVEFSPDGSLLASASGDHTITLWRVSDGTLLRTLEGHDDWVSSVDFSPDGNLLASASDDATVRLWKVSDGALLQILEHNNTVYSAVFSPDGDILASGSRDGTVRLWKVR